MKEELEFKNVIIYIRVSECIRVSFGSVILILILILKIMIFQIAQLTLNVI